MFFIFEIFIYIYCILFFRCAITNSILCNGCVIEEGTTLKNCLVGAKFTVPSGGDYSHEMLTDADELMEI